MIVKKGVGQLEIPAKVQGRHQGGGQDFRIADQALGVLPMSKRFQEIVTQAIDKDDGQVHRASSVDCGTSDRVTG